MPSNVCRQDRLADLQRRVEVLPVTMASWRQQPEHRRVPSPIFGFNGNDVNFDLPPIFDVYSEEEVALSDLSIFGSYKELTTETCLDDKGFRESSINFDLPPVFDVYVEDTFISDFLPVFDVIGEYDQSPKIGIDFFANGVRLKCHTSENSSSFLKVSNTCKEKLVLVDDYVGSLKPIVLGEIRFLSSHEIEKHCCAPNLFDKMFESIDMLFGFLHYLFDPGAPKVFDICPCSDKAFYDCEFSRCDELGGETENTHKVFHQIPNSISLNLTSFPLVVEQVATDTQPLDSIVEKLCTESIFTPTCVALQNNLCHKSPPFLISLKAIHSLKQGKLADLKLIFSFDGGGLSSLDDHVYITGALYQLTVNCKFLDNIHDSQFLFIALTLPCYHGNDLEVSWEHARHRSKKETLLSNVQPTIELDSLCMEPVEKCSLHDVRYRQEAFDSYTYISSCTLVKEMVKQNKLVLIVTDEKEFAYEEHYLKWRWKPNVCDSLAKNLWESLSCILDYSIKDKRKIAACAKHLVRDGGTTYAIDENNIQINPNEISGVHMPTYYNSVNKWAATIMVSYSSWNGKRMHANHDLVTGYLKNKLKFWSLIISVWQGIDRITSLGSQEHKELAREAVRGLFVQSKNVYLHRVMGERTVCVCGVAILCFVVLMIVTPSILQSQEWHDFADQRFFGIPITLNVISNFPVFVIGLLGLVLCYHGNYFGIRLQGKLWGWTCFFVEVTIVALGMAPVISSSSALDGCNQYSILEVFDDLCSYALVQFVASP